MVWIFKERHLTKQGFYFRIATLDTKFRVLKRSPSGLKYSDFLGKVSEKFHLFKVGS